MKYLTITPDIHVTLNLNLNSSIKKKIIKAGVYHSTETIHCTLIIYKKLNQIGYNNY